MKLLILLSNNITLFSIDFIQIKPNHKNNKIQISITIIIIIIIIYKALFIANVSQGAVQ